MTMGEHNAFFGAKSGKAGERGKVSVVEGVVHHSFLAGKIQVAGLNTPVRVAGIPPVVDFAYAANEELGIDQGAVAADIVLIHLIKVHALHRGIGGTVEAAFLEVTLDIINKGLVAERFRLVRHPEEVFINMFGGIKRTPS